MTYKKLNKQVDLPVYLYRSTIVGDCYEKVFDGGDRIIRVYFDEDKNQSTAICKDLHEPEIMIEGAKQISKDTFTHKLNQAIQTFQQ